MSNVNETDRLIFQILKVDELELVLILDKILIAVKKDPTAILKIWYANGVVAKLLNIIVSLYSTPEIYGKQLINDIISIFTLVASHPTLYRELRKSEITNFILPILGLELDDSVKIGVFHLVTEFIKVGGNDIMSYLLNEVELLAICLKNYMSFSIKVNNVFLTLLKRIAQSKTGAEFITTNKSYVEFFRNNFRTPKMRKNENKEIKALQTEILRILKIY